MEKMQAENLGTYHSDKAPDKLAHVLFKTTLFSKMLDWYQNVFDAQMIFRNDDVAFMTYDEEHHRLAFARIPIIFRPLHWMLKYSRKIVGIDHIAFTFNRFEKLIAHYKRLKILGIFPIWCINHGPTTSFYYEDPDKNRLEFQYDNFESVQQLQEFANSDVFIQNPIGVNFDPDILAEKFDAGVSVEELIKQGSTLREGEKPIAGYKTINFRTL